ncbi:FAD/NAD(P)-binding protein [Nonomuraea insulae]|uniref:FAD/NAD(P)-binding protein n=1 Tax=Nonomuraea insulae TaxID=1616787 RepID=A0ABW1D5L4_9ACTN
MRHKLRPPTSSGDLPESRATAGHGTGTLRVAVVGAGPRGLAVAARLVDVHRERAASAPALELHLIDPMPGGRVWQADQDPALLMNSRTRQATLFADDSVPGVTGPPRGPSFLDWCAEVAPHLDLPWAAAEEAKALTPDGFGSRALFGHYTRWVLDRLTAGSVPAHVHAVRATALAERADGAQVLALDDAVTPELVVDAVVLALGHLPVAATERERELTAFAAENDLLYVPPGPATAAHLAAIRPGEEVAVLGSGLNFYDVMALLTVGRGGRHEAGHYVPSGREPVLLVGSGRGMPYLARAVRPGPVTLEVCTPQVQAAWLAARDGLDVKRDVWPVIEEELRRTWEREAAVSGESRPFELAAMIDPLAGGEEPGSLTGRLRGLLAADLASATATPRGSATAVGETLAKLKDVVRDLVAEGVIDGRSVLSDLHGWFRSVGGFLAAGPPARRVAELIALIDAGLVRFLGPGTRATTDPQGSAFLVTAREPSAPYRVRALLDARMPEEDVRRTTDPLVRDLLATGLARPATLRTADGGRVTTGGLDVTRTGARTPSVDCCRLIAADGTASPRRLAIGLPVQPLEWNIANLPQPGQSARTLIQAEMIARHLLALTPIVQPASVSAETRNHERRCP